MEAQLKRKITFLDTEVYKKNNKVYTKICRKETDKQTFLNTNPEYPTSIKNSILYSQGF